MIKQEIKWSPQLLNGLFVYLGSTAKEISQRTDFRYSMSSMYNVVQNKQHISQALNEEYNRLFYEVFHLNSTDLVNIYKIIELQNTGKIKFKNRRC
ncbi:hypothetical protein [Clostridium tyrobutyricum]|uniref:hypothetical protein n=1 Tax=Clostridium tyrobutyricum TaxID=1519 RepID=UPI001C37FFD2|nr:hypothetical protein [Clostridium tyrobutyricum]MBV4429083.1 hypothetical protein [Clostridium tyrobutyricum]MBV4444160.1 hypothetical protein [Clostridium tyrobutyricum]